MRSTSVLYSCAAPLRIWPFPCCIDRHLRLDDRRRHPAGQTALTCDRQHAQRPHVLHAACLRLSYAALSHRLQLLQPSKRRISHDRTPSFTWIPQPLPPAVPRGAPFFPSVNQRLEGPRKAEG